MLDGQFVYLKSNIVLNLAIKCIQTPLQINNRSLLGEKAEFLSLFLNKKKNTNKPIFFKGVFRLKFLHPLT